MGTKGLLNIAAMLCAAGLLVILVQPGPLGPGMRTAAVLILALLAVLYVVRARSDAARVRDLEDRSAGAGRVVENIDLRTIIDGVPDPTVIVNKQRQMAVVNKAGREAFGLDESDEVPCYRALHGLDAPCDESGYPCVLQTGESRKTIQTRQGADGGEYLVESRTTPLFDESGNVMGAVEVLHDLNEQERLALKLQRAKEHAETVNNARREFIASLSHDVRTPLNAMLGMADLLRLTALTRKQKTYVQIMQSSSNMLLSLVDNMIDFAEIESGKFELEDEPFRVVDLLEQVLSIMGYQAYSKGLELAGMTGHDMELEVTGDFYRLRQILINLVSNAIKFTPEGEVVVDVSVEKESDGTTCLSVTVADSGIGIPETKLGRLFTPFESAARRSHAEEQGSGLGLAVCKRLVDAMGGRISLESEVGKGTTAWFSVPVSNVVALDSATPGRYEALRSRRLLIVNRNARVAAAVCQLMDDYGLRCDIEPDPTSTESRLADASAAGDPYDCILVDVPTRTPNRLKLARKIRETQDIPIVLLTSIAQPLKVGEVSSIGNIRAVNKPVLPSELRHNLYRLLEVDTVDPSRSDALVAKSLRILIAEDNPINRKVLEGMLRSLDLEADTVCDGPSVLEVLKDSTYDLILMDCQMPGMDGDEVTKIIREERRGDDGQPVVVAITADVSEGHREKCLAAGMDDFLTKPIRLETLTTGLRRWAGMSVSRRSQLAVADAASAHEEAYVEQLQERAGVADSAVIGEFIDLFLDDTASRIETMHSALEQRDLKAVRRECHALKGACLELGVTRLGAFCDELGLASREQRFDDLPLALGRLSAEFDRVRPIFEAGKESPR